MEYNLLTIADTLSTDIIDRQERSFALVSNSGDVFDLLTEASIVFDGSTEQFLYEVNGLGYEYDIESMNIGNTLVLSNYELVPQTITGTIMFDSYTTYYKYLAFIYQHQNMEEIVYNTEAMLNLEYKNVIFNGTDLRNLLKIVASKADISEKKEDGLLYVPITYMAFSKTNRQLNAISTGELTFEDNNDHIFPLPSILNGEQCEYIGIPNSLPDEYSIKITNPTEENIPLRFIFEGNFINPRFFIRGETKKRGQIFETGGEGTLITIDSYTKTTTAKNGTDLSSSLAVDKENYISLSPGENDIIVIFQDGKPNGEPCSLTIEAIVEE